MAFRCVIYYRGCCHFLYMPIYVHSRDVFRALRRRYMAEIFPIWRKTLYNQSIDQSIRAMPESPEKLRFNSCDESSQWRHHLPWRWGLIFSANDRFTLVCRNFFRCSNLLSIEYNFNHNKNIFFTLRLFKTTDKK